MLKPGLKKKNKMKKEKFISKLKNQVNNNRTLLQSLC